MKSNILGFLERDPEDATLSGFLNEIALYTDLDGVEAGEESVMCLPLKLKDTDGANARAVLLQKGFCV